MAFGDIPIRVNNKDMFIDAAWFNSIRTELINAFGTGGYIFEQVLQSKTAGSTITVDSVAFKPLIPLVGNGGPVTLSLTPFGTSHGFQGGKEIILMGTSDTNTVTIEVDATDTTLESVASNGKIVLGKYNMVTLIYSDTLNRFVRSQG